MNSEVNAWAIKWGVPLAALIDLQRMFGILPPEGLPIFGKSGAPGSEAVVQSLVRLEAARKGLTLWRNNVGVLTNAEGTPVRYGLGNDSPRLNRVLKSGDLIGWRPVLITPAMVGTRIAQFVSRECKAPGWTFTATEREQAQLKWAQAVRAGGGDACFVTGEGSL